MINRLKKPRNVALLTLGLAIISVIYSIVQGIRFPEYFEYTIYEILIMTSLSTAIYFALILLGRNINVKKINRIMIVQYIVAFAFQLLYLRNYNFIAINTVNIAICLILIILLINFYLIVENKKYKPIIFLIIEYILLFFIIIPFFAFGIIKLEIIINSICYGLISRGFLIPFIFYLYLYGKSKVERNWTDERRKRFFWKIRTKW